MPAYIYRGKDRYTLDLDETLVVVRTRRGTRLQTNTPMARAARSLAHTFHPVVRFPSAGVEVFRSPRAAHEELRAAFADEAELRFVGRGLCDPRSKSPVVYTENLFVKFADDCDEADCVKTLDKHKLAVKKKLGYSRNAYFVGAPEGTGRATFELAEELLAKRWVQLCHPELIREVSLRGAFPQQWHLKTTIVDGQLVEAHANVEAAWAWTRGEGITIAVIDDGLDVAHEEFATPGKIVHPYNATLGSSDPRPGPGDSHGTACAGVACADGLVGASGVAPRARIMPIRLYSGLGSQQEANAIEWAQQHGADVISCSWGPVDGPWWDPAHPNHALHVPLPDSTRLAIDEAIRSGRDGKGCVFTWAAGNGHENVENDGYASYDSVIAVAACNDRQKASAYSDYGPSIWCAFPSNDGEPGLTPGIWTTDRSGREGYNEGNPNRGDAAGNYTDSFGGTSSAAPGVAGVAALILARNPALRWDEVKEIIKATCDRIDEEAHPYDRDGRNDIYGFGRVNAAKAVQRAAPVRYGDYTAIHTALKDVEIKDFSESLLSVHVGDDQPIRDIRIGVDIEHSWRGDLIVKLICPDNGDMDGGEVTLYERADGGVHDLKTVFDIDKTPELAVLRGRNPKGTWTLAVQDAARYDTGTLRKFSVELLY